MKTIKVLMFIMLLFITNIEAQTIFSNGTGGGNWNSASTWLGGVVPSLTNDVVIAGTDSVAVVSEVQCNNLNILGGAKFAVLSLTQMVVANTLEVEDGAIFYNASESGRLPGAEVLLGSNSTVVHIGSGTVGGAGNLEFGNLIIRRTAGAVAGGDLNINGNLIIDNSAANVVFRGSTFATGGQTHHIQGNVYIYGGTWSCIDVGDNSHTTVWNVFGNVYVQGPDSRMGPFSSANASGLGIFNINGDLIINQGRLHAGTSSSSGPGTGIINLGGNFRNENGNFATNSLGPFAINFVGTSTQTVTLINSTMNLGTNVFDTIKATSTVVFDIDTNRWGSTTGGAFVVNGTLEMKGVSRLTGAGAFTLNPNATLRIGHPFGIASSGDIGAIWMSNARNYSQEAFYEYKSTASQVLGSGLPNTVNGLIINNPNGITLDRSLTINRTLTTSMGSLNLNGNTITLGEIGTLTESAVNTVRGSGKLVTVRDLNAPNNNNVGGLGVQITSAANLGSTTIERYHEARTISSGPSVLRYYNIAPANNSGLNATLRMYYDESELNGNSENNLALYKSADGNSGWALQGGSRNPSENYVELSGVNDFSFWTLGTDPLSVEVEEENAIPDNFILYQNYPNPFNPTTNIKFSLPEATNVMLAIYNHLGEEVEVLVNEFLQQGTYRASFDASIGGGLPSGIYIYRLNAGSQVLSGKMMLLK